MKRILAVLVLSGICFSADIKSGLAEAQAAIKRGDLASAEQILNDTISEAEAKPGPRAIAPLDAPIVLLKDVYQREKKFAQAASVQQLHIEIMSTLYGADSVVVAGNLGALVKIKQQAADLSGAEEAARKALAILTTALVDQPPAAQAALDLADVLFAEEKGTEGEKTLALAQKIFSSSLGPRSILASRVAARRAVYLRRVGRTAEADELARITPSEVVFEIGRDVSQPKAQYKVEPAYSAEAKEKKLQGTVRLSMVIDATGAGKEIAVMRPLGLGLDEKAIEAVSQWKFIPAKKNGEPVSTFSQIEVTFHLQ